MVVLESVLVEPLSFEYQVLKHYLHKGIWARAGLIDHLIKDLKGLSETLEPMTASQEYGLNDHEVAAALQVAIISHLMMFIEDLGIICKAISEGKIDYYKYLDTTGDDELGRVIAKFFSDVIRSSDEEISRILSYTNVNAFEFVLANEKATVMGIVNQMIAKAKFFFNKVDLFRHNHIKILRRYKHAGFPILLAQPLPPDTYQEFEFGSLGLTSKETIEGEMVAFPYSAKVIESYANLKSDIFSFLGNVLHFKLICMERNANGLIPHKANLFGLSLPLEDLHILDEVWNRFESRYPMHEEKSEITLTTMAEILRWYEEIENTSKRVF